MTINFVSSPAKKKMFVLHVSSMAVLSVMFVY